MAKLRIQVTGILSALLMAAGVYCYNDDWKEVGGILCSIGLLLSIYPFFLVVNEQAYKENVKKGMKIGYGIVIISVVALFWILI